MAFIKTTLVFNGVKQNVAFEAVPRVGEYIEYEFARSGEKFALRVDKICQVVMGEYSYEILIYCSLP